MFQADNFNSFVAATPDDFRNLPTLIHKSAEGIFVGTAGDIVLVGGDTAVPVTFKNVPSGTLLDIRVRQIMATGTTAQNIVVLYRSTRSTTDPVG